MIIGAIKSDQSWRVFSILCQILVRVIWLSSVVNRVSRYYHLSRDLFPNIKYNKFSIFKKNRSTFIAKSYFQMKKY